MCYGEMRATGFVDPHVRIITFCYNEILFLCSSWSHNACLAVLGMKKIPPTHRNYTMTISVLFTVIVIKIPSPVFLFHDRDSTVCQKRFRFGQFEMLKTFCLWHHNGWISPENCTRRFFVPVRGRVIIRLRTPLDIRFPKFVLRNPEVSLQR
jgi:hypothetical protein